MVWFYGGGGCHKSINKLPGALLSMDGGTHLFLLFTFHLLLNTLISSSSSLLFSTGRLKPRPSLHPSGLNPSHMKKLLPLGFRLLFKRKIQIFDDKI
jgi:hypothetical protein